MRCIVAPGRVACETYAHEMNGAFPNGPIIDGAEPGHGNRANVAAVDDQGHLDWAVADVPGADPAADVVLTYGQVQHLHGWTIVPTVSGTRFTNDTTGHGLFASIANAYAF
jgi:hypothetical protein